MEIPDEVVVNKGCGWCWKGRGCQDGEWSTFAGDNKFFITLQSVITHRYFFGEGSRHFVWVWFGKGLIVHSKLVCTQHLHAAMEDLDVEELLASLVLLIPIGSGCHPEVLAAS